MEDGDYTHLTPVITANPVGLKANGPGKNSTPLIQVQSYSKDALSPPWILDLDNSMGASTQEKIKIDEEYGEAIVEILSSPREWVRIISYSRARECAFNCAVESELVLQEGTIAGIGGL